MPDGHCYSPNLPVSPSNTLSPMRASMKHGFKFQLTASCKHKITLMTFEVFILRGTLRKPVKALSYQSIHRILCRYKSIDNKKLTIKWLLGVSKTHWDSCGHVQTGAVVCRRKCKINGWCWELAVWPWINWLASLHFHFLFMFSSSLYLGMVAFPSR